MTQLASRFGARHKRHARIRLRVEGSGARPRLAVFRSLNHIYAQVIDDASGKTLAAASTLEKDLRGTKQTKSDEAKASEQGTDKEMTGDGMMSGVVPGVGKKEDAKKLLPVTAWGRYAKILLSSSEFLFVN